MKVIVLAEDDEIDGVFRVAGEVVTVDDGYAGNVRRVIADKIEQRNKEETKRKRKKKKERDAKQDKDGNPGRDGNSSGPNDNGTGVGDRTGNGRER